MEHVDRPAPFGGDEHQIDVAPRLRHGAAHAVQQAERVFRDDLDDGVAARRLVVAVDDRREPGQPPPERAFLAALQPGGEVGAPRDDVLEPP